MPDYQRLQSLAEQADDELGKINTAAGALIDSGKVTAAQLSGVLAPLADASAVIAKIAAWGRDAQSAPAKDVEGYPRIVNVAGVNIMAAAPINPAWKPGMSAFIFGRQPGTFVQDPAVPAGARSPQGFPTINGRVVYADQDVGDDAGVVEYEQRVALSGQYDNTQADVPGRGFRVMDKAESDAILAKWDQCMAAGREDWAFYGLTVEEHSALQNRGWKRNDVNLKINQYNGGAAPRDIEKSPRRNA